MLTRIRNIVIHPIFFAIYPVLFFYSHNISELRMEVLAVPLTFSVFATLILWLIFRLFFKDIQKSALLASFFVFLFYSFAHFYKFLEKIFGDLDKIDDFILIPYLVFFIAAAILIKRMERNFRVATNFFTVFSLALLVISVSNIISFEIGQLGQQAPAYNIKQGEEVQVSGEPQIKRDIYFIVLDSYARDDVLQQDYGYDNAPFLNFLKEKGFYIVPKSRSNYAYTHLSLTSTLNLTYLDGLFQEFGTEKEVIEPKLYQMLHQNKAAEYLKSQGYTVINFDSTWGSTENMQIADMNIRHVKNLTFFDKPLDIDYFLSSFLQTTAFSPFIKETLSNNKRDKILYNLKKLKEVPYMRGNKFVIAHFLMPHPPALFDENGTPVSDEEQNLYVNPDDDKKYYLGALKFTNKKVQKVVEKILSSSNPKPIIIIESDHGPFLTRLDQGPTNPSLEMAGKRMSNFSAYYLPDGGDKLLYESITPVNTFRTIFNYYFGANYEILPDKVYFSWRNDPYKFYDFTDQIK